MKVKLLSRVRLFATPWTTAHQAPPSMGFSRQEYWSGVPLPSLKNVFMYYYIYLSFFHTKDDSVYILLFFLYLYVYVYSSGMKLLGLELLFQKEHIFIKWTDHATVPPETRADTSARVMMTSLLFSALKQVWHINQVRL